MLDTEYILAVLVRVSNRIPRKTSCGSSPNFSTALPKLVERQTATIVAILTSTIVAAWQPSTRNVAAMIKARNHRENSAVNVEVAASKTREEDVVDVLSTQQ